ncbi:MAG: hypothetical protein AB8C13_01975 [Phycisphaerales bacterium]
MDDRQTEIRSGAGLEDSRINKEFIDFLNKWSSPVILVFAIAALVWAGLRWMEQKKIEKIDLAFGSLQAATLGGNPSPASLNALAEEYKGVKSVSEIAKLTTADMYISAFLRGVEPGAQISTLTGEPVEESDKLDDQQREAYLRQAETLANEVVSMSSGDTGKALMTIQGFMRLGAIAECNRDFDRARSEYGRAIDLAEQISMPSVKGFAQMRLDAVDSLDSDLVLPSRADLVSLPGEEIPVLPEVIEPVIDPATDSEADPATGAESDGTPAPAETIPETAPEDEPDQP